VARSFRRAQLLCNPCSSTIGLGMYPLLSLLPSLSTPFRNAILLSFSLTLFAVCPCVVRLCAARPRALCPRAILPRVPPLPSPPIPPARAFRALGSWPCWAARGSRLLLYRRCFWSAGRYYCSISPLVAGAEAMGSGARRGGLSTWHDQE
jgi:hypothetical protein